MLKHKVLPFLNIKVQFSHLCTRRVFRQSANRPSPRVNTVFFLRKENFLLPVAVSSRLSQILSLISRGPLQDTHIRGAVFYTTYPLCLDGLTLDRRWLINQSTSLRITYLALVLFSFAYLTLKGRASSSSTPLMSDRLLLTSADHPLLPASATGTNNFF